MLFCLSKGFWIDRNETDTLSALGNNTGSVNEGKSKEDYRNLSD